MHNNSVKEKKLPASHAHLAAFLWHESGY